MCPKCESRRVPTLIERVAEKSLLLMKCVKCDCEFLVIRVVDKFSDEGLAVHESDRKKSTC